jgi:putative aminopeptidase FrvX
MVKEIETNTNLNSQKVGIQEVPQFEQEIKDVQRQTAEALIDCAIDPQLGNVIATLLPV